MGKTVGKSFNGRNLQQMIRVTKEIVLKLATNEQSDKGFLLTSAFVPKGLSVHAPGLYE